MDGPAFFMCMNQEMSRNARYKDRRRLDGSQCVIVGTVRLPSLRRRASSTFSISSIGARTRLANAVETSANVGLTRGLAARE